MSLQPTSLKELQSIIKSHQALLPYAGGSKPALSAAANDEVRLDMSRLTGIIEYEPDEYTFTAYAGTPVGEVETELAKHGQYLPFDPILVKKGATLGGTVAANSAGSGRYRYGGIRDFILGVRFFDGMGQLVRGGGKVVKNSAGFDLPKFMVGSLGRYGIFADLSFKVFPQPRAYITLKAAYADLTAAMEAIFRLATAPFDIDALDLVPLESAQIALLVRFGGLADALPDRSKRLLNFLNTHATFAKADLIQADEDKALWTRSREFEWVTPGLNLIKVPISPKRIPPLDDALSGPVLRRYSAGGSVAWLASPDVGDLHAMLTALELSGLVLDGPPGQPYIGLRQGLPLAQRVKKALDPAGKFLAA